MTITALIQKPVQSKGIDLALCKRLAQEACRRASATESWAVLVFGRLTASRSHSTLRLSLPELAELMASQRYRTQKPSLHAAYCGSHRPT